MTDWICKEVHTDNGGYFEPVTELIQCKDCRYYGSVTIGNRVALTNFCSRLNDCTREEEFCSRAERKE